MQQNTNRRKFLLSGAQAVALIGLGGLVWGAFLQEKQGKSSYLETAGCFE